MRLNGSSNGSTRSSALWGKPSKGETRSSALWGKGGRGFIVALVLALSLAMPLVAVAGVSSYRHDTSIKAYLSPGLLDAVKARPNATYDVIVQAERGDTTAQVASDVKSAISGVVLDRFRDVAVRRGKTKNDDARPARHRLAPRTRRLARSGFPARRWVLER